MSEPRRAPQLMFDDGSRVIMEETVTPPFISSSRRQDQSIEEYYEVDRLAQQIKTIITHKNQNSSGSTTSSSNNGGWSCRVALQFPDHLLQDAPNVCWAMEQALEQELDYDALVFVLGDTTFGPCCPDEVAALHLSADVLVHYGHACLSPAQQLPVLYSFGKTNIDVDQCVEMIVKECKEQGVTRLLLLYEVKYHHAMVELEKKLMERGDLLVLTGQIPHSDCGDTNDQDEEGQQSFRAGGLLIPSDMNLSTYTLLFIGDVVASSSSSSRQYVNTMLRFLTYPNGPTSFWTFAPQDNTLQTTLPPTLQKQLQRRYYLTQKAKDASCFGILVGTLSKQHFSSVVTTLKNTLKDAGKASYTFAVGKVNAAKLANFADIECFILVACSEHSLLGDERDLHVPVITPLELYIALGHADWGVYSLEYNDVSTLCGHHSVDVTNNSDDDDGDAPYYSLATGKYVDTHKSEGVDLMALPGKGQVMVHQSKAAEFLRNRQFQGLEAAIGETQVHVAKLGDVGIASNYGER